MVDINLAIKSCQLNHTTRDRTTCASGDLEQSLSIDHCRPTCKTDDDDVKQRHGVVEAEVLVEATDWYCRGGGSGATSRRGWIDGSLVRVVRVMSLYQRPPLCCIVQQKEYLYYR